MLLLVVSVGDPLVLEASECHRFGPNEQLVFVRCVQQVFTPAEVAQARVSLATVSLDLRPEHVEDSLRGPGGRLAKAAVVDYLGELLAGISEVGAIGSVNCLLEELLEGEYMVVPDRLLEMTGREGSGSERARAR